MGRGNCRGVIRDQTGAIVAPLRIVLKQGGQTVGVYLNENDPNPVSPADFANGFYSWWQIPGEYTIEFYKQTGGVWETTPFLTITPWMVYPKPTNTVETDRAKTITAVHTFNPSSPGPPFALGANARGQLVAGLNAEFIQGQTPSQLSVSKHLVDVYVSANTSLSTNTRVVIPFNTKAYDPDNLFNTTTYTFTSNMSALYLVSVVLGMNITNWDFYLELTTLVGTTESVLIVRSQRDTLSAGSHSHTVSLGNVSTSTDGFHGHNFSGTTDTRGAHTHNVGGSCSACSPTSTDGNHYHSFSGSTAGDGSHYHTVGLGTPSTSVAGDHVHRQLFDRPWMTTTLPLWLNQNDTLQIRCLIQNSAGGFPTTWTCQGGTRLRIARLAT